MMKSSYHIIVIGKQLAMISAIVPNSSVNIEFDDCDNFRSEIFKLTSRMRKNCFNWFFQEYGYHFYSFKSNLCKYWNLQVLFQASHGCFQSKGRDCKLIDFLYILKTSTDILKWKQFNFLIALIASYQLHILIKNSLWRFEWLTWLRMYNKYVREMRRQVKCLTSVWVNYSREQQIFSQRW